VQECAVVVPSDPFPGIDPSTSFGGGSNAYIGDCGLTYQEVEGKNELEIGYHVVAPERRKGFATEAALACLDWGFTHTSADAICSIVRSSNIASQAVAARLHASLRMFTKNGTPALFFFTPRSTWAN
jgi:RimJ/RimL family protein N-acetyltransferase